MPSHEIRGANFWLFWLLGKLLIYFFDFWIWIGFFAEKENHQTDIEYNHKMAYTKRLACKH
jgi:hypothetical protein